MKGFAHIGVLRALEERGIGPTSYAGTSIGALIAAAHLGGMSRRRDATRARVAAATRPLPHQPLRDAARAHAVAVDLPRGAAARAASRPSIPDGTFDELPKPLLVNTVDLERGAQVVWGLPGLQRRLRAGRRLRVVRAARLLPARATSASAPASTAASSTTCPSSIARARRRHHHRGGRRQLGPRAERPTRRRRASRHLHARRDDDDARAAAVPARAVEGPPMVLIRPQAAARTG